MELLGLMKWAVYLPYSERSQDRLGIERLRKPHYLLSVFESALEASACLSLYTGIALQFVDWDISRNSPFSSVAN